MMEFPIHGFYRINVNTERVLSVIHNLQNISDTHLKGDNSQYIAMATTLSS